MWCAFHLILSIAVAEYNQIEPTNPWFCSNIIIYFPSVDASD